LKTRTGIIGTGSFLPSKVLTNDDLEKMVDTSDEWIKTRTGILERRIADKDTASSDLGLEAAKKALDEAKIGPREIDLIVCATATPDMFFPSTACLIQRELGTTHAFAFDISAACSGFVYAIEVANQFIKSGKCEKALVIGVETISRITDYQDRNTCILFGDGAGAVVLAPVSEEKGILGSHLASDGREAGLIKIPAGGSRLPATCQTVQEGLHCLKMKGNEVFKLAIRLMSWVVHQVLEECGLRINDVDLLIPHQANMRIITALASRLRIPIEKVAINVDKYGNTSAATCPIALDEAVREGRIKDGDIVVLVAMGSGLTWGANVIRWGR